MTKGQEFIDPGNISTLFILIREGVKTPRCKEIIRGPSVRGLFIWVPTEVWVDICLGMMDVQVTFVQVRN